MTRFNSTYGAVALGATGLIYMVAALASGHSAASTAPLDLSAPEAGVGIWPALALVGGEQEALLIDARTKERAERFPLGKRAARTGPDRAAIAARIGKRPAVLIADSDATAARFAGELEPKAKASSRRIHYLRGGTRTWYLALELPVALFADKPPQFGYDSALARVKRWLAGSAPAGAEVTRAVDRLAAIDYQPTALKASGNKKATGTKRKKITGGCG